MATKEEARKLPFTGSERMGAILDPGTRAQEGRWLIILNMVQQARDDASDPRLSGELTIEVNAWLDAATLAGPMWGTFIIKNSAGRWLCAWIGKRTAEGTSSLEAWGYGAEGYAGLMAHWKHLRPNPDPNAPSSIKGYIATK
jgi:hypothetical protein